MITERIDAITRIDADRRSVRPPAPRAVKVELSPRCNYRCGFCALRTRERQPSRDMPWDLFLRVAALLKGAGVEEVGLFYLGEPFMNPALLRAAVAHLKRDLGIPYVFLTTNGSLASRDAVRAVMDAGLDSLKWSVNAATPSQCAEVFGVQGNMLERALGNLRAAREVRDAGGYRCRIYASSIRYDDDQPEVMRALLAERVLPYVDEHYWLPLYSMGSLAAEREAELGYRPSAGNQGRLGALREPLPCWSVFTEGHVTAQGLLSACCFDADGAWSVGDLRVQGFMEAWHSDAFVALREAHLRRDVAGTACERCVAYAGGAQ